ncbi:META domain-containing protein [Acinetobacter albensis]|uniref:META domain-containing protein n=1 Tax=Acinetobacter albensis TaxID=1673609 RepID=A0ABW9JU36_9GAMM
MLNRLFALGLLGSTLIFTGCESIPTSSSHLEASNLMQLQNRTWFITHVGNSEAKIMPNMPSLQFDAATKRVTGSDGCNRLMGSYEAGRDTLVLSQMASTKMACFNGHPASQTFKDALPKVANYQVFGKTLKLLDRHGNSLIQMQSNVLVQ